MKLPEQAERAISNRGVTRTSAYHRHLKRAGRKLMRRLRKMIDRDMPPRLPVRGYEW